MTPEKQLAKLQRKIVRLEQRSASLQKRHEELRQRYADVRSQASYSYGLLKRRQESTQRLVRQIRVQLCAGRIERVGALLSCLPGVRGCVVVRRKR